MKISQVGLELIKKAEGFSPTAYPDADGFSIGYGCFLDTPEELEKYKNATISKEEATILLEEYTSKLSADLSDLIKVPVNQNQFDAIGCFVYNIGLPRFKKSTFLEKLNEGKYEDAANEILRWNKSQGKVLNSLVIRREIEKKLFQS